MFLLRASRNVEGLLRVGGTQTASRELHGGATAELRRDRGRSGWRPPVDEDDQDYWIFPRERHGKNYRLNWTINSYKMTPTHEAYRNLHFRGLEMLSSGKRDANKALHITIPATKDPLTYDVNSVDKSLPVPADDFRDILRQVRMYFSKSKEIFVTDGTVGSESPWVKGGASIKTRVFADNAETALFLETFMPKVPLRDPGDFDHDLSVYVMKNFQANHPDSVVDLAEPFVVTDVAEGVVLVGNVHSNVHLAQAMMTASRGFLQSTKDAVIVPHADAAISKVTGESALLFHTASPQGPLPVDQLFSQYATIWGTNGLSRVWDGIASPLLQSSTTQRGDIVEVCKGRPSLLFSPLRTPNQANTAPHPTRAVFFVNQGKSFPALSKLDNPSAVLPLDEATSSRLAAADIPSIAINLRSQSVSQISDFLNQPIPSSLPSTPAFKKTK